MLAVKRPAAMKRAPGLDRIFRGQRMALYTLPVWRMPALFRPSAARAGERGQEPDVDLLADLIGHNGQGLFP